MLVSILGSVLFVGQEVFVETNPESKHWLQTLPGLLTALAGLIGAITALIVALVGREKPVEIGNSTSNPARTTSVPADGCMPPYVWRLAVPSDYVCVTQESRKRVELENQRAAERRQASGGAYGPDTCQVGYVWREAFEGDTVCVLPERREEVRKENALAYQRIKR
jgi:hypothetical protein